MNAISTHAAIGPRRVPIDDERWVSIRPIEPSDGPGLSDFYAGLSPESRRRRFLGSSAALDDRQIALFTDEENGVVGVLVERGPDDGAIVAHGAVLADGHGAAEAAFAVADRFQECGIGRALVSAACALARRRGLRSITATMLADNAPMRRLLRSCGCIVVVDEMDAGVEEVTLLVTEGMTAECGGEDSAQLASVPSTGQ